jgi:hypothetical protein
MLEAGLLVLRPALTAALLSCLGQAVGSTRLDTLRTTLRAVGTVSVVDYIYEYVPTYYLSEYFGYGHWYNPFPPPMLSAHEHATFRFDLSPIPDTALLTAAEFGFCQYSDDTAGTPPYNVRVYDYSGADAESLFNAIESAGAVSADYVAYHGWNRAPIADAGVAALRARLVSNTARLAVAENAWGDLGYAYGSADPETLRPYLLLSYLPTAVEERPTLHAERPTLDARPNPVRGQATVRWESGGDAAFTLRDAAGRVVLTRRFENNAIRLDCSRLAGGIYFARCVSGGRTAVARLVVE